MDIDRTPAVYLTVILWLAFFLATRNYRSHFQTANKANLTHIVADQGKVGG